MDSIIVSYYTKDSLYELEANDLILSCRSFNLDYLIESIVSLGSWEKNCCYKPKYIYKKLIEYQKPVLWIDADAIIVKKPIIDIFLNYDFAFCFKYDQNKKKIGVRAGTIFINYTKQSLIFLKEWDFECQRQLNNPNKTIEIWDQKCLFTTICNIENSITFYEMPISYCKIFDRYTDKINDKNTFIIQFQASRVYKNFINNNLKIPSFLKNLPPMELKKLRFK